MKVVFIYGCWSCFLGLEQAIDLAIKSHKQEAICLDDYGLKMGDGTLSDSKTIYPVYYVNGNSTQEWKDLTKELLAIYNKGMN